jgi:pimeloyl-ACP methyl ester carboxylesterase
MGADHRVFKYLQLPEGYEPSYIQWIPPLKKESLRDYAYRLTQQIETTQPFVIAGVSLGGMLAVEIAKRITPVSTILISSVPVSTHLPKYYRLAGALGLGKLIPATLLKSAAILKHSLMMYPAEKRRLMRQVIWSSDDRFIRWALNAVLEWDNKDIPSPLFHIHGTRDETLPGAMTTPTHIVQKGGHMLLVSRPETVNQFLRDVLPPIQTARDPMHHSLQAPPYHPL